LWGAGTEKEEREKAGNLFRKAPPQRLGKNPKKKTTHKPCRKKKKKVPRKEAHKCLEGLSTVTYGGAKRKTNMEKKA